MTKTTTATKTKPKTKRRVRKPDVFSFKGKTWLSHLLRDLLDAGAVGVYFELKARSWLRNPRKRHPTIATLAYYTNQSEKTVRAKLALLVRTGWITPIEETRVTRRVSRYTVNEVPAIGAVKETAPATRETRETRDTRIGAVKETARATSGAVKTTAPSAIGAVNGAARATRVPPQTVNADAAIPVTQNPPVVVLGSNPKTEGIAVLPDPEQRPEPTPEEIKARREQERLAEILKLAKAYRSKQALAKLTDPRDALFRQDAEKELKEFPSKRERLNVTDDEWQAALAEADTYRAKRGMA